MPDYQISYNKVHATLVVLNRFGVLLMGKSGVGKSDLALRLIENKQARLVADDVVVLSPKGKKLVGCADDTIKGLLEVRGLGIIPFPYETKANIDLIVQLHQEPSDVERCPQLYKENILGVEIPRIDLYAKECSAVDKICVGIRFCCENGKLDKKG